MSATAAVKRDLKRLPKDLAESGLAAAALALADRLDNAKGSPSECARVLAEVLIRLRELAPPAQERTALDELRDRRSARLAGGAAGKD